MQSTNIRPSNALFAFPLLSLDMCDLSFGSLCISVFPSGSPDLKKKKKTLSSDLQCNIVIISYDLGIPV